MSRSVALTALLFGLVVGCGDAVQAPPAGCVVGGVVRRDGELVPARVRLFLLEAGTVDERQPALLGGEMQLAGLFAAGEPVAVRDAGGDGRYRFEGLEPGRYQVHAVDAGGAQAQKTLDLPAAGVLTERRLDLVGGDHVLRGRAVHADGRPFEGRVWVVPAPVKRAAHGLQQGTWPVDVGDAGTFEIRALATRAYDLFLSRRGGLFTQRAGVQLPRDEVLEVVVDEGAVEVGGRILGAPNGEPISGAVVSIRGRGPGGSLIVQTKTDADGRFSALGPPEKRWIAIRADGYVPVQVEHTSDADFLVHLRPFAVIRGQAVDLATGRGVAGARVHACPIETRDRSRLRTSVLTGEDGSFTLDRVTPGEAMLYVTGSRWISSALLGLRDASQCPCPITMRPGEVREVSLPVVLASRASGRVLDAEGVPVAGVLLRADRTGRATAGTMFPPYRAVTATDADGRFVFDDLVSGLAYRIGARPAGRAGTSSDVVYPSISLDVELRLPPPRWLEVRVVERDEETPVEGARVTVTRTSGTWRTDADGRARTGPLGVGKVQVWADHPSFVEMGSRMAVPGSEGDGDPPPVVVRLARGHVIRGRAFLPDGRPQTGGTVRVESGRRLLAARVPSSDGSFVFSRLPAGHHDVIAQCTVDGRSYRGDARGEAGGGDVLVPLREAGAAIVPAVEDAALRVRVLDEEGRPVVGGTARLHGKRPRAARGLLSAGEADLLRLDRGGESWIEVSGAESVEGAALAATLFGPVASSDREVEIRLPVGATVTGRVLDLDEMPVAGIHLYARGRFEEEIGGKPVDGRHAQALTNADGSFVLEGLGEAEYVLGWALPRRFTLPEAVVVEPGDRDVVVVVESALAGTLTVVDDDGRPVVGAAVHLDKMPRELPGGRMIGYGGRVPPYRTDAAGEHPFGPLDDAFNYSLRVEPPEDRPDLAVFEEAPWTFEAESVRLRKGLPLRGHVRLLGGRRIDELRVRCKPAGCRTRTGEVDPDGSFAFHNLPPGPVSLGIQLDRVGMDTWSRRIEVLAGKTDVVYEIDLGEPLYVEIENWPKDQREYMRFAVLLPESHLPKNPSLRPRARLGRTMRFEGLDADEAYTLRVVGMDDGTCFVGRGIRPGPDPLKIRLVPGLTIRGLLMLPPGHERPRVHASSNVDGVSGRVDERGEFVIQGLPPGAWRVKAEAEGPDDAWSRGDAVVEAGAEVDVVLEAQDD